jgi:hypothetical protein
MKILSIYLLTLLITVSAFASASRTLDAQFITNGSATLTLPSTTDTIVGRNTTGTLTNKSMDGSTNTFTNIPTSAIAGSALSGSNSGDVTLGTANGLSLAGQVLSLQLATGSVPGALSAADWTTFNSKLTSSLANGSINIGSAGGVATPQAVSGDATLSNAGVLTIGAKKIQASKLDSGAATSGYVATADGSGGVSYAAPVSVAPNIVGSRGTPTSVVAAVGVVFSGTANSNSNFIQGAAGPVTVSATPQITAATNVGQFLRLIGRSGTNTVTLADGNGLSLNGAWVGGLDSVLELFWDGTNWLEVARR